MSFVETDPDFHYPLTLGIRIDAKHELQSRSSAPTARTYETWTEGVSRTDHRFDRTSEAAFLRSIETLVSRERGIRFVLGEPGAGKSSLMEEWFRRRTGPWEPRIGMTVPVLVRLREIPSEVLALPSKELAQHFWTAAIDAGFRVAGDHARAYVSEALGAFTPMWLLDGLDEVDAHVVTNGFFDRISSLPGAKIVTCRTAIYEELRGTVARHRQHQEGEYHVLPLGPEDQAKFLHGTLRTNPQRAQALHRAIQKNAQLRLLAGSPLLLSMMAEDCDPSDLPLTRAAFYRRTLEGMWLRKLRGAPHYERMVQERDGALCALARDMGLERIEADITLLARVEAEFATGATKPLVECLESAGLLKVDRRRGRFSFVHLTFQEYYLARSLQDEGLRNALDRYWKHPRYEETLALLVSLMQEDGDHSVAMAVSVEFVEAWRNHHRETPQTLWREGRSPLRTVLHVFGRSGVRLDPDAAATWITPIPKEFWGLIARDPRSPDAALELSGTTLPMEVAKNISTPPEFLAKLAADPFVWVRAHVAENVSTPAEVLAMLASDPEPMVRYKVAEHVSTPAEVLAKLAADPEPMVRWVVARNRSTPTGVLAKLAIDPKEGPPWNTDPKDRVRRNVALNPNTPAEGLAKLASDPKAWVRENVALNHSTPAEVLTELATDFDASVRRWVACHANTPAEVLVKLAADPDVEVLYFLSSHPNAPTGFLAKLTEHPKVSIRRTLAGDTGTPAEFLAKLATDPEESVRGNVAANASTPTEVLEKLVTDPEESVRGNVAANANTPAELLAKLVSDPEKSVRVNLAANVSTPAEVLAKLVGDPVESVRETVTENDSTSAEVLATLASDPEPMVRYNVAKHLSTPVEALTKLATDCDRSVRCKVADNANTPADVLANLGTDCDEEVRRVVAWNAGTPADVLVILAADPDLNVRWGITRNFRAPAEVLAKLAADPEETVRIAAVGNSNLVLEDLIS